MIAQETFDVIVVGGGVWIYRWYYTTYVRDPRYWSRRNFDQDGKLAPPSGEICIGAGGETQPVPAAGAGAASQ